MVRGDARGSVDVLAAGVDYLRSLRVYDSDHRPAQKYTNWWVCSGGERSWRGTKITEPRQERMGLESNVCAGRIFWTRSNSSWQGECCDCQHYIKLAYRVETLIRPFECSLCFFFFFVLFPMGGGRVFGCWGGGGKDMGGKTEGGREWAKAGGEKKQKKLLEII